MTPLKSSSVKLLFALPLLAGATALAQQPAMQSQQPAPAQQQPSQPSTVPTSDGGNDSSTPNYADVAFVEDTLKDNDTQIQLSQLAQQKASSGDVKDFSQRMIQIHNQLNQQLVPLAKRLDVNQNQKPNKQEKKEIAQLQQLSGADFDAAYLQAMAREQEHTLKQLKNEESAQNPILQKVARADEPVLTQHYQTLQKIAQTHNIPLTEK